MTCRHFIMRNKHRGTSDIVWVFLRGWMWACTCRVVCMCKAYDQTIALVKRLQSEGWNKIKCKNTLFIFFLLTASLLFTWFLLLLVTHIPHTVYKHGRLMFCLFVPFYSFFPILSSLLCVSLMLIVDIYNPIKVLWRTSLTNIEVMPTEAHIHHMVNVVTCKT